MTEPVDDLPRINEPADRARFVRLVDPARLHARVAELEKELLAARRMLAAILVQCGGRVFVSDYTLTEMDLNGILTEFRQFAGVELSYIPASSAPRHQEPRDGADA